MDNVALACYRAFLAERASNEAEYEKQARIARALEDKRIRDYLNNRKH